MPAKRSPTNAERTITRVAGYVRVSTDEQAQSGLGLADQRRRISGMAAAKGWPDATFYADEGISGTKDAQKRDGMRRLLLDIAAGKVDAVIILSLDRLARKTLIVLDLVDTMSKAGVSLVSCKESLDTTTPQGQFVLTMFAALAQLERDLISERTRAALAELGRTTGDPGGRMPYGYLRTLEGALLVDEDAAATVRRIFAARRRGESLRAIAHKLMLAGVPSPRGGPWGYTTIASILDNRAVYAGGKRADSQQRWPAILGKREAA